MPAPKDVATGIFSCEDGIAGMERGGHLEDHGVVVVGFLFVKVNGGNHRIGRNGLCIVPGFPQNLGRGNGTNAGGAIALVSLEGEHLVGIAGYAAVNNLTVGITAAIQGRSAGHVNAGIMCRRGYIIGYIGLGKEAQVNTMAMNQVKRGIGRDNFLDLSALLELDGKTIRKINLVLEINGV